MRRLLPYLCILFSVSTSLTAQAAGLSSALSLRLGMLKFKPNADGYKAEELGKITNYTNIELEWSQYALKDFAYSFGYRLAYEAKNKIFRYQAAFSALRYYPFTLGIPVEDVVNYNSISYDFFMKPYIRVGVSFGRVILDTVGLASASLEASAPYFGIMVGNGIQFQITHQLALDFYAGAEIANGLGEFAYGGFNLFVQSGLYYYF